MLSSGVPLALSSPNKALVALSDMQTKAEKGIYSVSGLKKKKL